MPYSAINIADIVAGKPTKEEIFSTIRDNQESFNTDIEALKQTSQIDVFNVKYTGDITNYTTTEINARAPIFKAPVSFTIVNFLITLLENSGSGTLEIDIEKSVDNGVTFNTLLNNPVEVTATTAGSLSGTVDFINAAAQEVDQGDLLRVVVTGLQTSQGDFHVSISGELGG